VSSSPYILFGGPKRKTQPYSEVPFRTASCQLDHLDKIKSEKNGKTGLMAAVTFARKMKSRLKAGRNFHEQELGVRKCTETLEAQEG
jgi:hypothetical protein